jgi:uncharacterized membrane protein HdeD (DUF308 family)
MEETWKSTTGGILSIIGGVIAFFASMGLFIASTAINYTENWVGNWGLNGLPINITSILLAIAIPLCICGIIAIIGGIFALQRKCWGLALAGSIAAFFPASILGLGSVVFIAISRDEFGPKAKITGVTAGKSS